MYTFFLLLVSFVPCLSLSPYTPCYINISDGMEACYYLPDSTVGYECEYCDSFPDDCSNVDSDRRNLTFCGQPGSCYLPLALLMEVCYYTPPDGFACYYEYEHDKVVNLTLCDDLKANSPPEIILGNGARNTDEDTPLLINYITIFDFDADDAIVDGNGDLLITLVITNGQVGFLPSLADSGDQAAAAGVLASSDLADGVIWETGNGNNSYSNSLSFRARRANLEKLMKAFVFLPAQDFNTNLGNSEIDINVNDQGNTGGSPEIDDDFLTITAAPLNDAPVVNLGALPPSNEDVTRSFSGLLSVSDVDANEISSGVQIDVILTVFNGKLQFAFSPPVGTTVTLGTPVGSPGAYTTYSQILRGPLSGVNTLLNSLQYTPNLNHDTTDQLEIVVDDNGHTGDPGAMVTNSSFTIPITPVNDDPVVSVPTLITDEDTAVNITNVNITDVDTTSGITVELSAAGSGTVYGADGIASATVTITGIDLTATGSDSATHRIGEVTYLGAGNFFGTENVLIFVDDGSGGDTTDNIQVIVEAVNDAPYLCITDAALPCDPGVNGAIAFIRGDSLPSNYVNRSIAQGVTVGFNGGAELPRVVMNDVDILSTDIVQLLVVGINADVVMTITTGITVEIDEEGVLYLFGTMSDANDAIAGLQYTKQTAEDEPMIICASDQGKNGKGDTGAVCINMDVQQP